MRRPDRTVSFLRLVRTAAGLIFALIASNTAASGQNAASQFIRTLDSETRAPVQGARIVVNGVVRGWTDADGRLPLDGLARGEHSAAIRRMGYIPQKFVIVISAQSALHDVNLQPMAVRLPAIVVENSARWSPLNSVQADRTDLAAAGSDAARMIGLVRVMSGSTFAQQQVIIEGLETTGLPAGQTIRTVAVNNDPYSVVRGESEMDVLELSLDDPPADFRWGLGLLPNLIGGRNPLASHTSSRQDIRDAFIMVPFGTSGLNMNGNSTRARERNPVIAVPGVGDSAAEPALSKRNTQSLSASLFHKWSDRGQARLSFTAVQDDNSNSESGGLIRWSSPTSASQGANDLRITGETHVGGFSLASGLLRSRRVTSFSSSDSRPLMTILETAVMGDPAYSSMRLESGEWRWNGTVKSPDSRLLLGWALLNSIDREILRPNPNGELIFARVEQYIRRVDEQHYGFRTLARGKSDDRAGTTTGALFAEREFRVSDAVAVRAGLRTDYLGGSWLPSPRLSMRAAQGRMSMQSGIGVFRQPVSNQVLLQADRFRRGSGVGRFATVRTESLEPDAQIPIYSGVASNFRPPGNVSIRNGAQFGKGNFNVGVEHLWSYGFSRPGSRRVAADAEWSDILESNRRMKKHQLHARADYRSELGSLFVHYEWIRQVDDGEGPFSFPERQNDLRREWARSAGVSPHNFSVLVMVPSAMRIDAALVFTSRSPAPLNIRSGADPEGLGLFTDRGGRFRNSGTGPGFSSLDAFLHKRVRIPFMGRSGRIPELDLSLVVDNLLDQRNFLAVAASEASPIFGKPVSAAPGRSLQLSLRLAH